MTPDLVPDELCRLLNSTSDSIVIVDEAGRIAFVNAQAEKLFGYVRAELFGQLAEVLIPDWSRVECQGRTADGAQVPRARPVGEGLAASGRRKDGIEFPVEINRCQVRIDGRFVLAVVTDAGGRAPLHLGQVQDVTARKSVEDEVRRGAARFRAFFEATTAGMVEFSPDARILRANDAFCRMVGYTPAELCEMTVADLLFPEDRDRVLTQYGEVGAGRATSYEADGCYRRKDGSPLWARVSLVAQDQTGKPTPVSAVVIDLTVQKQLEEQFWHAQKVASVGLLAGGVAHDFNNLLTVINGYAQILLDGLTSADPTRELVQEMLAACQRTAGLTAQLLAFSRKATVEPRTLNLNEVVSQSARLLRRLMGKDITLVTNLADGLGSVKADPTQVEQVILNLALNAKDAMPQGGTLTIATHGIRLREDTVAYPDIPPGEYVQLTVSDTGVGMTDEVRARAFEPFFTTKEVGKGTGLGLALVHGAIKQSGGRVDVDSELGLGTTFKILLPAVAASAPVPGVVRVAPSGAETVLLVKDEDGM